MMELSHGRIERYNSEKEEKDASKNTNFTPSPSSSSSSSCWDPAVGPLVEREHMFDKVVTPSDVGKLNRLVIPKQHAERYFPLDPTTGDKGLLLCFEESGGTGKAWPFRYSYWNSSQSYVMTKGWSRFVKDKRLNPGDTVAFARGVGESGRDRHFIDWHHRPPEPHPIMPLRSVVVPWASGSLFTSQQHLYLGSSCPQPLPRLQIGRPPIVNSVPVVRGKAEPKRVRLFGVNLECSEPEDDRQAPGSCHSQRMVRHKPPLSPLPCRAVPPRSDMKLLTVPDLQFKGKEEQQQQEEE